MEFKDKINTFVENIQVSKAKVRNKSGVKYFLINPFLQVLGYDLSNPSDIYPDYECPKCKEPADYAILHDDKPVVIINYLEWDKLNHEAEATMLKYIKNSQSNYGVYTDGVKYQFYRINEYSKLLKVLDFDFNSLESINMDRVERFSKGIFDGEVVDDDFELEKKMDSFFKKELRDPSPSFIKFIMGKIGKPIDIRITRRYKQVLEKCANKYLLNDSRFVKETTPEELALTVLTSIREILNEFIEIERISFTVMSQYTNFFIDSKLNTFVRLHPRGNNHKLTVIASSFLKEDFILEELDDIRKYKDQIITAFRLRLSEMR